MEDHRPPYNQGDGIRFTPRRNGAFVVRIWWERLLGDDPLWRGQVVHAPTRQVFYFDCLEDLLDFIQRWTGDLHGQSH
jgi:hypothetical protein